MISRRVVQFILGAFWLIDGLLQFKPQMFTDAFIQQVILPTSQGQPAWVSALIHWGGYLVLHNIAFWNLLFAVVQVALGLLFMFNIRTKATIVASLIWCAIVWVFGEGFGQLLTGQALLITGAPGAVLIYGLIAISIFPKGDGSYQWRPSGIRFAQVALGILWAVGVLLHFQHTYLTPDGLSQAISVPWLGKVIGERGIIVSGILGLIELILAVSFLLKNHLQLAAWLSMILSFLFWWAGQSFGQVTDPLSTDLNTGPLMIVLAVCACPRLWKMKFYNPFRRNNLIH